jgi:uncharacterized membrane protein YhhN
VRSTVPVGGARSPLARPQDALNMSDWKKTYWKLFNLAGRFVGVCFFLGGVVFIIYGVSAGGALFVIPGLVVAVLGVLLFIARPYRPQSSDSSAPDKL